jgi:hypothetical protein
MRICPSSSKGRKAGRKTKRIILKLARTEGRKEDQDNMSFKLKKTEGR